MVPGRAGQLPDPLWWTGEYQNQPLRWGKPSSIHFPQRYCHIISYIPLPCTLANLLPHPQASLTYECTCANGTGPADIDQYQDTLPNHICQATFAQCRTANPGSDSCITCGTLKPSDVEAIPVSTSSAAASSSATAAATTPAASPSAMTTGTNGARKVEGAVGGLAAGVLAALVL